MSKARVVHAQQHLFEQFNSEGHSQNFYHILQQNRPFRTFKERKSLEEYP